MGSLESLPAAVECCFCMGNCPDDPGDNGTLH